MTGDADNPLGRTVAAPASYDPTILFPISRAESRAQLGIGDVLPFQGCDRWFAWELSWLDVAGVPHNRVMELRIPADSPAMVESKSLKLYLQSFNRSVIGDRDDVQSRIASDLGAIVGAPVTVVLHDIDAAALQRTANWQGTCIDVAVLPSVPMSPDPQRLQKVAGEPRTEILYSHRFRSVCPVTGQPDWATVTIGYSGLPIDHAALGAYLLGFRDHAAYHEQCVEQIWCDLNAQFAPAQLDICANFLRRGGIDINPRRCSGDALLSDALSIRQ